MKTAVAFIVGSLALGGCASSQAGQQPKVATPTTRAAAQPESGMGGGRMGHDMAATCPMAVEGTTARAEDVDGGAALTFTTTGDVAELRHRIAHMAEMHAKHHGEGHGGRTGAGAREGMMGGGAHEGMMEEHKGMMMPPSTARSEEVEGGARLIITPRDPADLAKLREHAREHAEKMASGQCPMMAMHGHGDESATGEHGPHEGHHPGHKD